jgi:hypothetical protein
VAGSTSDFYHVPGSGSNSEKNLNQLSGGHSAPAPTSALRRMDGKWSGNSFLLGSSSLANHGG